MQTKYMVVPFFLLASACSGGDPVDIGDNAKIVRTGEKLSDYAATWTGYVEAGGFPSGSDRVEMTIDENGQGTIILGEGVPPAPPTDPTLSWPEPNLPVSSGFTAPLIEGYPYTINGAVVEIKRLRLGVDINEEMRSWCELQTSYFDEEHQAYTCLPDAVGSAIGVREGVCYLGDADDLDTRREVPCFQMMVCVLGQTCSCTETGCTVPSGNQSFGLDAALEDEGETLDGTLMGQRVRMERQ